MPEPKNVCPQCGGRILIEALGRYGDIYRMKANGEMPVGRLKRRIYRGADEYLVYCDSCDAVFDAKDFIFWEKLEKQ